MKDQDLQDIINLTRKHKLTEDDIEFIVGKITLECNFVDNLDDIPQTYI